MLNGQDEHCPKDFVADSRQTGIVPLVGGKGPLTLTPKGSTMATERNNKPAPVQRYRYIFGWLLALGASVGDWTADCPVCGYAMTIYNLCGIANRPNRYVVLAHTTPYESCGYYGPDVLAPTCNQCNDAMGEIELNRAAFGIVTAQDCRVDTPTSRQWRTMAAAELDAQRMAETAEESARVVGVARFTR